jgi:hypothetical protein
MNSSFPVRPISSLFTVLLLAAALAGCQTDTSGAPKLAAAPKPPMTHRQAALDCWMGTEHGHADMPLDKRANIVDECIKEKMAGEPLSPDVLAAEGKAETKSKAKPKPKS